MPTMPRSDCPTPRLVEAMRGKVVIAVAGGWRHTMATDDKGVLYAWGWNKVGAAACVHLAGAVR